MHLFNGHDVQYYGLLPAGHKMHTAMSAVHASLTLRTLSYASEWLANISRMIASGWIVCISTPLKCLRIVFILLDWYWYAYLTDWLRVHFSIWFLSLFVSLVSIWPITSVSHCCLVSGLVDSFPSLGRLEA